MFLKPGHTDYIDLHSHYQDQEQDVFRVYNLFLQDIHNFKFKMACSAGLHPWHLEKYASKFSDEKILQNIFSSPDILLIGETGLDKLIETNMETQMGFFEKHIKYSEEFNKALVIHCVKAYEELLSAKKKLAPKQAWIIHGFNASPELASNLIDKGFYFSLGQRLLGNKEKSLRVLNEIPLSRLFLETDDDVKSIKDIYSEVSKIYKVDVKKLRTFIYSNYLKITSDGE